jgi:hypothetical protein
MLKFEMVSKSYAIAIEDVDEFLSIDKYEGDIPYDESSKCLYMSLEKIDGIHSVDYNGHFGSYIYLTVEEEHDTIETHKKISDLITNQIELAREYVLNPIDEEDEEQ